MADEILAGSGGTGTWTVAEALSRYIIAAAYGNAHVLSTARIDDPEGAVVKRYNKYPLLADAALTEVEEIANTAFVPTDVSVTTARFGLALEQSDLSAMTAIISIAELGVQMGRAMRSGIETRLAARFADFTATPVGTTGVALDLDDFLAAMLFIESADLLDRGPIAFIGHPKQTSDLRAAIQAATGTVFGATGYSDSGIQGIGDVWDLWGVAVMSSTKVELINTAADHQGAMYPAGQLGPLVYQVMRDPSSEIVRGNSGARKSATTIVGTAFYGAGNIDPEAGIPVVSGV